MNWTADLNSYCERLSANYWAEPVNALTNFAFLVAAFVMWRRLSGPDLILARLLTFVLGTIGIGSFLFHTHAQVWAAAADTAPILMFVLLYIYAANRTYWGLSTPVSLGLTAMFFPYAAATIPLFQKIPGIGSSAVYWPVPALIAIYAVLLRSRLPSVALGLGLGAGVLSASLVFRSLDEPLCSALSVGTHYMWHLLNALMLGWMIEVYRRHVTAARSL